MKISEKIDMLRMEILSKGYDHLLGYDDLDCLFELSNKIRRLEK